MDLDGFFKNRKIIFEIIKTIKKNVNPNSNDTFLIGIGFYGGLLCSLLGLLFNMPFTYYFTDVKQKLVDASERAIGNVNIVDKKILVITDIVLKGDSIMM